MPTAVRSKGKQHTITVTMLSCEQEDIPTSGMGRTTRRLNEMNE
eukprot:CAMPEP_0204525248 /NCGR_PEP_ID=MMETSP0661-20131031/7807_1 /ASSEMBLY_ACC=CAM_ASM_000606 /TAXON_ID=109239 /ORGANISM="Alexandrium margalefi, Strain AMGDE01CS-322" /LENGTH=43 /DNA_ID= /DNA_START= /DNA_END= /DNA_ORIENTATION=